jgi:hypothetical protein
MKTPVKTSELHEALHSSLRDLRIFLAEYDQAFWSAKMLDLEARKMARPRDLGERVLELFGGMGSLNDLYFQDDIVNEEYQRQSDNLAELAEMARKLK